MVPLAYGGFRLSHEKGRYGLSQISLCSSPCFNGCIQKYNRSLRAHWDLLSVWSTFLDLMEYANQMQELTERSFFWMHLIARCIQKHDCSLLSETKQIKELIELSVSGRASGCTQWLHSADSTEWALAVLMYSSRLKMLIGWSKRIYQ